ncbi:MAG: DUF3604 domain-containing protein [Candidatus Brocadiia bacterium]
MRDVRKTSSLNNAWYPELATCDGETLLAWRSFQRDESVVEPDVVRVARMDSEGPEEMSDVCRGFFIDGPRLIRSADGWQLLIVRRQEDASWALECFSLGDGFEVTGSRLLSSAGQSVTGFTVDRSARGPAVAWVEAGNSQRRLLVSHLAGDHRVCLDTGPVWTPASAPCGEALIVGWEKAGTVRLAQLGEELQNTAETTIAISDRLLGHPDLDVHEDDVYLVCQSNGDWGKKTERLNGDTRLHAFRWTEGGIDASAGQPDGRIPVETKSRFESYRDEAPENRRLPASPRVVVDATGTIHVLFRHFRDAQENDWGWTLRSTRSSGAGFTPPVDLSRGAGYPDGQFRVVGRNDGYLIAVTETTYPVREAGFARRWGTGSASIALYQVSAEKGQDGPWEPLNTAGATVPSGYTAQPRPRWDDMQLIYADLHRHSYLSRCIPENDGEPLDHLRWAMDYEEMGSICLTDHWLSHAPGQEVKSSFGLIDACGDCPDFTPIFGAEPGVWQGVDTNIYWRNPDVLPEVEHILDQYRGDLPGAISYIRENDLQESIIVERHFHGMLNRAWQSDLIDHPLARADDVEPLIEVIQNRGPSIPWYCRLLENGQHKGVTGGSDHCRPSDRKSPGCFTGLWVEDISEDGIWDALVNRRTFATNGHRMAVRLSAEEGVIGGTVAASGPVDIRWDLRAPVELQEILIYRNGHALEIRNGLNTCTAAGTVEDRPAGDKETSYFVVARSKDGGLLISSPLWISRT